MRSFSLLPVLGSCAVAAAVPSWNYDGFERFPALWFGANATGLDSAALPLIGRHGLAGYGWQQGTNITDAHHGEAQLAQAAIHLSDYVDISPPRGIPNPSPSSPPTPTKVFVYRHSQMAWTAFDITRGAVLNPSNAGMFLRNESGALCAQKDNWSPRKDGISSPLFAWGNGSAAAQFWTEEVVGELAAESGVDAVFFDETDWSYCGYNYESETGCPTPTQDFLAADQRAKHAALAQTATVLNNAGKLPIFSSINYFNSSRAGLSPSFTWHCVVDFREYADALANVTWTRFEEIWMNQGSGNGGTKADADALQIASAIELWDEYGVPIVAHSMAFPGNCSNNATEPPVILPSVLEGSAGGGGGGDGGGLATGPVDLVYSLAAFLIVQQPYSYFGVSSMQFWYDADYCWHPEYDLSYGSPLAAANRTGPYSWFRNFTGCDVEIDTSQGKAVIRMK